VKP
jgi:hypothetical protein